MAVAFLTPDVYMTNGKTLFRIVRCLEGVLLVENCAKPDEPLIEMSARELRRGVWRTVEPKED